MRKQCDVALHPEQSHPKLTNARKRGIIILLSRRVYRCTMGLKGGGPVVHIVPCTTTNAPTRQETSNAVTCPLSLTCSRSHSLPHALTHFLIHLHTNRSLTHSLTPHIRVEGGPQSLHVSLVPHNRAVQCEGNRGGPQEGGHPEELRGVALGVAKGTLTGVAGRGRHERGGEGTGRKERG